MIIKKLILAYLLLISGVLLSQVYLVSFSSNILSTSGGANKSDLNGANLFSVFYKPKSNDSIWGLKQLTNISNKSEAFPSISPDTNWIAYNYTQKTPWHNEVRLIKRLNGTEYTIFNKGRFPQWINNNQLVLSDTQSIFITRLSFPTGTPNIVSNKRITTTSITPNIYECEDPYPFNNGTKILFHGYNSITGSTALCQIDSNGTNFLKLSSFSAYGHGIVASNNSEVLASQANTNQLLRFTTNTTTFSPIALNLPTSQSVMSTYDVRYATANAIKWAFVSWGHNDRSFFASCSGEDASNVHFISRIFYVEYNSTFTTYTLYDFSKKVEQKLGAIGKDFISTSAITLLYPTTSIKENNTPLLNIFPNPNNGNFVLESENDEIITIYNMLGKELLRTNIKKGSNKIHLQELPNGNYFLRAGNTFCKIVIYKP